MSKRRSQGFTLVEMMITVIILGVLTAVAIPSFTSLVASQKVKTTASSLQAFLNVTRTEALKRNSSVTLSPNTTGQWSSGWKITDPSSGSTLKTTSPVTNINITGPSSVIYQGSGRVKLASGVTSSTFKFSSTSTHDIRCLEIDLSGIAMITSTGC